MSTEPNQLIKTRLHIRNRNRERYDLEALLKVNPELQDYIKPNKRGEDSVDFSDPKSVKVLNRALLNQYYGIKSWEFPNANLCPPIPGRADYLHYAADLLAENNAGEIPKGNMIKCLDIGVGASCIYPIIGVTEYDWDFIGSDIDPKSIESADEIVKSNPTLKDKVSHVLQKDQDKIFDGVIGNEDKTDIVICNPPFHSTASEAKKVSKRKVRNLTGKKLGNLTLNFSGKPGELVYPGGEYGFIQNMITQSANHAGNVLWFTTLVSKQANLRGIYKSLDNIGAKKVETIPMGTGNKSSRIVAWTFLSKQEQREWRDERWSEV
ncbi:MAG: 23S rRNA (adenine1618-N6)-methyltransferase [Patiriisocius sp.]|jgi:23S rRNA (adenine1618-N6)-methyltransferase